MKGNKRRSFPRVKSSHLLKCFMFDILKFNECQIVKPFCMFIFTFTNLRILPLISRSFFSIQLLFLPQKSMMLKEFCEAATKIVAISCYYSLFRSVRADVSLHTNHMLEIWQNYSIDLKSAQKQKSFPVPVNTLGLLLLGTNSGF